jgi:hypothetical protein
MVNPPETTRPDGLVLYVEAGAGDDAVVVTSTAWTPALPYLWVELGAGNDVLVGSPGSDLVADGPGIDWVLTGPGTDLVAPGGDVGDRVDCGEAEDIWLSTDFGTVNRDTDRGSWRGRRG